jgi:hypothetical protein
LIHSRGQTGRSIMLRKQEETGLCCFPNFFIPKLDKGQEGMYNYLCC